MTDRPKTFEELREQAQPLLRMSGQLRNLREIGLRLAQDEKPVYPVEGGTPRAPTPNDVVERFRQILVKDGGQCLTENKTLLMAAKALRDARLRFPERFSELSEPLWRQNGHHGHHPPAASSSA